MLFQGGYRGQFHQENYPQRTSPPKTSKDSFSKTIPGQLTTKTTKLSSDPQPSPPPEHLELSAVGIVQEKLSVWGFLEVGIVKRQLSKGNCPTMAIARCLQHVHQLNIIGFCESGKLRSIAGLTQ